MREKLYFHCTKIFTVRTCQILRQRIVFIKIWWWDQTILNSLNQDKNIILKGKYHFYCVMEVNSIMKILFLWFMKALKSSRVSHDDCEGYYARCRFEEKYYVKNNKANSRSRSESRITC